MIKKMLLLLFVLFFPLRLWKLWSWSRPGKQELALALSVTFIIGWLLQKWKFPQNDKYDENKRQYKSNFFISFLFFFFFGIFKLFCKQ